MSLAEAMGVTIEIEDGDPYLTIRVTCPHGMAEHRLRQPVPNWDAAARTVIHTQACTHRCRCAPDALIGANATGT